MSPRRRIMVGFILLLLLMPELCYLRGKQVDES